MMRTTVFVLAAALVVMLATLALSETKPEIDSPSSPYYSRMIHSAKVDVDYKMVYHPGVRSYLIAATHGGNIEPGSTELAEAIAGGTYGFYAFNGIKRDSSAVYVASNKFDEPEFGRIIKNYGSVIAIHVIPSSDRLIYVGGGNRQLGDSLIKSLTDKGYQARVTPPAGSAWDSKNAINKNGQKGVQIEVASALIDEMFRGPVTSDSIRRDPTRRTPNFDRFVSAISLVLGRSNNQPTGIKIKSKDDDKKKPGGR